MCLCLGVYRCLVVFSSWLILNTSIHVTLILAILMVTGSLYLYNVPASTPTVLPIERSKEGVELAVHKGIDETEEADEQETAGLLKSNGAAAG